MTRIVSGTLFVPYFEQTALEGEYAIVGGIFENQADATGNAAYDLEDGSILYVPVVDPNSMALIPGVVNRYRVTQITVWDANTIDCIINYDHHNDTVSSGYDLPADSATCLISAATPNHGFGSPVSPAIYPELAQGLDVAAIAIDNYAVTDKLGSSITPDPGGETPVSNNYLHTQSSLSKAWAVNHNKNSVNFNYALFDDSGRIIYPDSIQVVTNKQLLVNLLEPMKGKIALTFM